MICKLTDACQTGQPNQEIKQEEDKSFSEIFKQAKFKIINEHEAQVKTPLQDSTFRIEKLKQSMGVGCELCTIVMNAAKFLVENKVDNTKIFKFVEKELCGRLGGSLNQTCVDYVEQEGPLILAMLEKSVDVGLVCRAIGLCLKVQVSDDEANQPKFYDLDARTDMNCTLCKVVFTQVKQMLVNQQSSAKILDYINTNLCSRTGSRQETCKSLINTYGPTFLRIISQDIHPDQLCSMIGMCKQRVEKEEVEMMSLIPAVKKQENHKKETETADPQCILCEFVINLVSKRLSQNTTEPELEKILQNVCNKAMPSNLRQECNQFVQQYGPIIINLLINQVEPERICRFINLCPSHKQEETQLINKKQEAIKMIELNPPKILKNNEFIEETPSAGNRTIQCSLCIYAAEIIDKALETNKTEEEIVNELRQVCNLFPGDLKNQVIYLNLSLKKYLKT